LQALPKISGKVQVAILGTGKAKYESMVKTMGTRNPSFKGVVKFSAPLAHLITAGADFILVPSRFEPCGLIQLHAMQYGTVPVVASTGGLVDTVKEGVTGFHMGALNPDRLEEADSQAIAATVNRASQVGGRAVRGGGQMVVLSLVQGTLGPARALLFGRRGCLAELLTCASHKPCCLPALACIHVSCTLMPTPTWTLHHHLTHPASILTRSRSFHALVVHPPRCSPPPPSRRW
jgi:hypothetical protein